MAFTFERLASKGDTSENAYGSQLTEPVNFQNSQNIGGRGTKDTASEHLPPISLTHPSNPAAAKSATVPSSGKSEDIFEVKVTSSDQTVASQADPNDALVRAKQARIEFNATKGEINQPKEIDGFVMDNENNLISENLVKNGFRLHPHAAVSPSGTASSEVTLTNGQKMASTAGDIVGDNLLVQGNGPKGGYVQAGGKIRDSNFLSVPGTGGPSDLPNVELLGNSDNSVTSTGDVIGQKITNTGNNFAGQYDGTTGVPASTGDVPADVISPQDLKKLIDNAVEKGMAAAGINDQTHLQDADQGLARAAEARKEFQAAKSDGKPPKEIDGFVMDNHNNLISEDLIKDGFTIRTHVRGSSADIYPPGAKTTDGPRLVSAGGDIVGENIVLGGNLPKNAYVEAGGEVSDSNFIDVPQSNATRSQSPSPQPIESSPAPPRKILSPDVNHTVAGAPDHNTASLVAPLDESARKGSASRSPSSEVAKTTGNPSEFVRNLESTNPELAQMLLKASNIVNPSDYKKFESEARQIYNNGAASGNLDLMQLAAKQSGLSQSEQDALAADLK